MKVWIDQDLGTGDGPCEEIAPDMSVGTARVPEGGFDRVIEVSG